MMGLSAIGEKLLDAGIGFLKGMQHFVELAKGVVDNVRKAVRAGLEAAAAWVEDNLKSLIEVKKFCISGKLDEVSYILNLC